MIAVAILAADPMTRARLESLVAAHPGLRAVVLPSALASTGDPALEVAGDVALLDPGARSAERILRALPSPSRRIPIVLVATAISPAAFMRLLRLGVRAVLPPDASGPEIASGIEAVAAGLVAFHPSAVLLPVTSPALARHGRDDTPIDPLTPRELEILAMIAEGLSNRAIAQRLAISPHTVKFHIAAILDKLNARSRAEAIALGLRQGLLMV